jgi:hypothetical protein
MAGCEVDAENPSRLKVRSNQPMKGELLFFRSKDFNTFDIQRAVLFAVYKSQDVY